MPRAVELDVCTAPRNFWMEGELRLPYYQLLVPVALATTEVSLEVVA
jgi:hypothetical protein